MRPTLWLLISLLLVATLDAGAMAQTSPFGVPMPRGAAPEPSTFGWLLAKQTEFHRAMTASMRAVSTDPQAFFTLISLAFGYGVLHAIGPGHGKAVLTSYLVANEAAMRRAVVLAFAAAFVQAAIALGLVIIIAVLLGGQARMIDQSVLWIERIGFAIILFLGLGIAIRKARALALALRGAPLAHPDDCACDHHHLDAPDVVAKASWRELALIAIGAGIRPCSGAIILLVFALSQGLFWAGAGAVAAMAIGTAIGTSAFAILAVRAKSFALGLAQKGSGTLRLAGLVMELIAGIALTLFGALLLAGAMSAGS